MAHRVTIQDAMKLTGKSRRTLYRDMDAGYVSWHTGPRNRRYFDIAELARAYGALNSLDDAGNVIPASQAIEAPSEPDPASSPPAPASQSGEYRELLGAIQALTEQVGRLVDNQAQMMEGMGKMQQRLERVEQKALPAPTYQGAVSARSLGQHIVDQGSEHEDPNGLHALVRALREKDDQERNGGLH